MSFFATVTEQMISQVKSRPVLWDKKNELYGNIQAMDLEWTKMSAAMKRDKEFLKKRWRTVRDVFRTEIRKLKLPANGEPTLPLINYYNGVWPHFESMIFLKDCLTKRIPRIYLHPDEPGELSEYDTLMAENAKALIDNNQKVEENSTESGPDEESPEDDNDSNEKPIMFENVWPDQDSNIDDSKTEVSTNSRGVKRKAEDWSSDLDEDVHFAKSIVGYLRRLNPIRKLFVRNDIQNILLRELLCDKCRCKGQKPCQCS